MIFDKTTESFLLQEFRRSDKHVCFYKRFMIYQSIEDYGDETWQNYVL